jgi:hypothetical protein
MTADVAGGAAAGSRYTFPPFITNTTRRSAVISRRIAVGGDQVGGVAGRRALNGSSRAALSFMGTYLFAGERACCWRAVLGAALPDFFAVHGNIVRRRDAYPDAIAFDCHDGDG